MHFMIGVVAGLAVWMANSYCGLDMRSLVCGATIGMSAALASALLTMAQTFKD